MIFQKKPKIAVLLAAYNGENYIEAQIDSIKKQLNVSTTIFISIDPSSDRTEEICKKIAKEDILILKNSNKKFGSAGKNFYHLFKEVNFDNFDAIALSDQDDLWKKDKLFRAWTKISTSNIDAYSSDVECFWDDGRENKIIKKSYPQKKYDYYFEPAGPGCTYVLSHALANSFQKEILHKENLPFHHDWYIYAYARTHGFNWLIDKEPNILYRQHTNNQVGANLGIKSKLKRFNLIKNGAYKKQVLEIANAINKNNDLIKSTRKMVLCNPFLYRRKKSEAIFLFIMAFFGFI